jgi:hypothetical protein
MLPVGRDLEEEGVDTEAGRHGNNLLLVGMLVATVGRELE